MDVNHVAFVDDDNDLRTANCQTLELAGFTVHPFSDAIAALRALTPEFPGVVVTDVRMPHIDGLEFFRRLRETDSDLPIILITGHGDIDMAVEAIHKGAYDFIAKPYPADRLVQSILRALEKRRLVMENRELRLAMESSDETLPLIGQTPVMQNLRKTLRHVASADVDVLIAGETGTGKEVVAGLLHEWSRRKTGNFVALNCGALPETVIESELFGHEAGAFTGAQKKRVGRIEHASGGTLFLDEIESMPLSTQVKLLRVLETREITPLGTNDHRQVDLRVVAAAKVDLGSAEQRANFREDLFYRLNVVTVSIPPLRERRDDIMLLFTHFLHRAAARFKSEPPAITAALRAYLVEHDWPGNVRELSHFAERTALGLQTVEITQPDENPLNDTSSLPKAMEQYEAKLIRGALSATNGDVRSTIEALGIPRKTFYDKLQRHGIDRSDYVADK
ncbi:sigma-54 dependent transcriptional regulator [Phyllobacterium sp. YR531]|uniref:sigma-54-dependent transcriptional regulator n=1 Tax=Phyllobacterium sp. YR531 TaxID=1144343 RepID=UPI00026F74E7|nr:sigma-54 dependent transcriptional regulator [Phyllobacterium sp. YR531]EJN06284.1 response regulator with CheY-like receiver, AAA-type ATPase, and DNA-binding domains [Phyllobacterium sp. YR531]